MIVDIYKTPQYEPIHLQIKIGEVKPIIGTEPIKTIQQKIDDLSEYYHYIDQFKRLWGIE